MRTKLLVSGFDDVLQPLCQSSQQEFSAMLFSYISSEMPCPSSHCCCGNRRLGRLGLRGYSSLRDDGTLSGNAFEERLPLVWLLHEVLHCCQVRLLILHLTHVTPNVPPAICLKGHYSQHMVPFQQHDPVPVLICFHQHDEQ